MGRVICPKHGLQGMTLVCEHLHHAVESGLSDAIEPSTITLDFDERYRNFDGLHHFVCPSCAAKVIQRFGGSRLVAEEAWEKLEEVIAIKPVCACCYSETFPILGAKK